MNMHLIIKHLMEIKTFSKTWTEFQAEQNVKPTLPETNDLSLTPEAQAKQAAQKKRRDDRKQKIEAQYQAIKAQHDEIIQALSESQQILINTILETSLAEETRLLGLHMRVPSKDTTLDKKLSYEQVASKTRQQDPLFMLAQLAFTFENNGVPDNHAVKLRSLCEDFENALIYLSAFSIANPDNTQFFHDACLFSLPDSQAVWDISTWRKLANNNQKWGNLINNNDFKDMLASADKIEQSLKSEGKILQKLSLAQLEVEYNKLQFEGADKDPKAAKLFK